MSLNPNQKRAVSVTLFLLEERLAEVEQVMSQRSEGILYRRIPRFTQRQQEAIKRLLQVMRAEIAELAERFQFDREEQDPVGRIRGLMAISWESLEESTSRRLKAYGDVDPQLKETLDPGIQKLSRLGQVMIRIAEGSLPTESLDRLASDDGGPNENGSDSTVGKRARGSDPRRE